MFFILEISNSLQIDIILAAICLSVFLPILFLCIRYVKREKKSPLVCKCKRGSLVKYEPDKVKKDFSCVSNNGTRKNIKNVYKCETCGCITIELK